MDPFGFEGALLFSRGAGLPNQRYEQLSFSRSPVLGSPHRNARILQQRMNLRRRRIEEPGRYLLSMAEIREVIRELEEWESPVRDPTPKRLEPPTPKYPSPVNVRKRARKQACPKKLS